MSYKFSHKNASVAKTYTGTYQSGYYYNLWKEIEIPLLHQIYASLKDDGATQHLDFASGTGRISSIAEDYFTNTAIDVSEEMLAYARKNLSQSEIVCADIQEIAHQRKFDAVSAFRFFLNAEHELKNHVLSNIHTLLNENGTLVFNIHVRDTSPLGYFYRAKSLLGFRSAGNVSSLEQNKRLLESNNFIVKRVINYGYIPRFGRLSNVVPSVAIRWIEPFLGNFNFMDKFSQCFVIIAVKNTSK
jgi:SAM-dependent methyltransferase